MWKVYARCECGWREVAPFGDKSHIHFGIDFFASEPKKI